jgi:hypothetical protein
MTPSRIEPATFWVVAQSLNQLNLLARREVKKILCWHCRTILVHKNISEIINILEE